MFKCWKYSGVKVWQSYLKKINWTDNIDIIIKMINSIISLKWQIFQIVIEVSELVAQRCCVIWKVFFEISKKFIRKHLCQSLFYNKIAGLRPATLLKKRLWVRCFPTNFEKFLRTSFLQNNSGGCFWRHAVEEKL